MERRAMATHSRSVSTSVARGSRQWRCAPMARSSTSESCHRLTTWNHCSPPLAVLIAASWHRMTCAIGISAPGIAASQQSLDRLDAR